MKKLLNIVKYAGIITLIIIIPYSLTILFSIIVLYIVIFSLALFIIFSKVSKFYRDDIYLDDSLTYEKKVYKYCHKVFKNQPLLRDKLHEILMRYSDQDDSLTSCCQLLNIKCDDVKNFTSHDLKQLRKYVNSFHPDISQGDTNEQFMEMNNCFKQIKQWKDVHRNS